MIRIGHILMVCLFIISCSKEIESLSDNETIIDNNQNTETIHPNILLIIADDMGVDATPGYDIGSLKPNMPTLNTLMRNGIRYTNVWSNPVCSPTRSTILTGKYGHKTGVLDVDHELAVTEVSLQSYIDEQLNGTYEQALIGKWHLSKQSTHPYDIGIPYYAGSLGGGLPSYWDWRLTQNNVTTKSYEYSTSVYTDLAIDWIEQTTKPWFLWLAYNAPHHPYHLPSTDLHSQGTLPDDDASIENNPRPYYFAMIEAMDSEIGRLLNSMDAETRGNTIVLFIGDNGTPGDVVQDYNSKRAKGSLYQGGINVPMIISGKGVSRQNEVENALINTTDLFATISTLTGIDTDEIYDSKSFVRTFDMTGIFMRDFVYSEIGISPDKTDKTIRNSTHKYLIKNDGTEALYNLQTDPLESINFLRSNNLPLSDVDEQHLNKLKNLLASINL